MQLYQGVKKGQSEIFRGQSGGIFQSQHTQAAAQMVRRNARRQLFAGDDAPQRPASAAAAWRGIPPGKWVIRNGALLPAADPTTVVRACIRLRRAWVRTASLEMLHRRTSHRARPTTRNAKCVWMQRAVRSAIALSRADVHIQREPGHKKAGHLKRYMLSWGRASPPPDPLPRALRAV